MRLPGVLFISLVSASLVACGGGGGASTIDNSDAPGLGHSIVSFGAAAANSAFHENPIDPSHRPPASPYPAAAVSDILSAVGDEPSDTVLDFNFRIGNADPPSKAKKLTVGGLLDTMQSQIEQYWPAHAEEFKTAVRSD